jgi:diaminohydroxyphosphoribosylaminopyrimidine deaminase/5-amino-6-(5-phosphoribosylamino)uracil reductase
MLDPNPTVAGGGNDFLLQQGIEVSSGILTERCRSINRPFIKWVTEQTPWVIIKAGVSLDGRIAAASNKKTWITNEKSRNYVHRLRDQVDAILIGIGTALVDDPSLTCRIEGKVTRDPLRVILDTHLRLPPQAQLLRQKSAFRTIIYTGAHITDDQFKPFCSLDVDIERTRLGSDGQIDLKMVLDSLAKKQVTSILVEGGCQVHTSFIRNGLADQAMLFYGPLFIGDQGVPLLGDCSGKSLDNYPRLKDVTTRQFDNDVLVEGFFETTCSPE